MILATILPILPDVPSSTTILQVLWAGLFILFVVSVFTAGFVAKKINNISGATYAKAFVATILKNTVGLFGLVFMFYLGINPLAALAVSGVVIPIVIYRLVFSCPRFVEATLVWLSVTFVEFAASYMLTLAAIIGLEALGTTF